MCVNGTLSSESKSFVSVFIFSVSLSLSSVLSRSSTAVSSSWRTLATDFDSFLPTCLRFLFPATDGDSLLLFTSSSSSLCDTSRSLSVSDKSRGDDGGVSAGREPPIKGLPRPRVTSPAAAPPPRPRLGGRPRVDAPRPRGDVSGD